MEEQLYIKERKWTRIVNTIVRWLGFALMAGLLVATAGMDLYRNHFRLFVITLCLIPVGVGIDRLISRCAKRAAVERLGAATAESESPQEKLYAAPYAAPAFRNFDAVQARFRHNCAGFEPALKKKQL